jgi:hypothetical protein
MKVWTFLDDELLRRRLKMSRLIATRTLLLMICMLVNAPLVSARPGDPSEQDKQTIQMLLQRIDRLEARVAQLEGARQAPELPAAAAAQTSPTFETASEPMEPERMDLSKTLLHIRGFGDVTYHGDTRKGDTTSFSLGQLNLFVTSDLSEKFKFLSEIVFEAGTENSVGVDVERLLLQYSPNDYFNVAAGRYHTGIGYYNTAYHHSTWLQTATGRPFLLEFEDKGGILPIHNVGVTASGLIPSGSLGLHYIAEVGNGRASTRSESVEAVQNVVDENNHKAFNLGFFARPEAVRGLQVGFSGYRDVLTPVGLPRIGETILDVYGVFVRPNFEWLNEALVVRHALEGSRVFQTPGFYSQISKRLGAYRPYFRYQYLNASDSEPLFPGIGLRHGPSLGLRYDASESVALKLQYDYTMFRRESAINGLVLQFGFTF